MLEEFITNLFKSKTEKAMTANVHAKAGETIRGNLKRGTNGQFASGGAGAGPSADAAKPKTQAQQRRDSKRQQARDLADKQSQERQDLKDQQAEEGNKEKRQARGEISDKLLGDDSEALEYAFDAYDQINEGDSIDDINPEYKNNLVKRGLLKQEIDGSYSLTPAAKAYKRAGEAGNEVAAKRALRTASLQAQRRAAIEARKAARAAKPKKKKEFTLKADDVDHSKLKASDYVFPFKPSEYQGEVKGDFPIDKPGRVKSAVSSWGRYKGPHSFDSFKKNLISLAKRKGQEYVSQLPEEWLQPATKEIHSFTIKQVNGVWRWFTISSSGYRDKDGQHVTTKALAEDVAGSELTGNYGPLLWWHIPKLEIGACDFRAMYGPLLLEAGTFKNAKVAAALAASSKDLGASLGFDHPGFYPDINGDFWQIETKERSLLPQFWASNYFTRLTVNQVKEKKEMLIADKVKELVARLGGNEEAVKEVESLLANVEATAKEAAASGLTVKEAGGQEAAATPPPEAVKTEKAAGDPGAADSGAAASNEAPDGQDDEAAEEGDMVMDMSVADFESAISDAVKPLADAIAQLATALSGQASASAAKEAATSSLIENLSKQLTSVTSEVKELKGDLPRGQLRGGYRASQDKDTKVTGQEEALKSRQPSADPLDEFSLALFGGGQ